MKYSVAIKHFKRIIDKKAVKDALRGVYHKDNTMTGTDSKRLLYCEVEKKDFEPSIVDINKDETIDAIYPKTENLFLKNPDTTINIDTDKIKGLKRIVTCIKQLGHKNVILKKEKDYWYIQTDYFLTEEKADTDVEMKYKVAQDTKASEQERKFQTKYLLNALEFIYDLKEDTQIKLLNNPLTQIEFSNVSNSKDRYKYLIMPLRNY
ncbi:hypothetical protein GKR13_13485 [Staphylococcus aureus]|uniref:hypothetical protein n=1 Tax=Staphylococcus aureus TaxID=1280 RepID=UPI00144301C7|nr:hypothetical protein [Staphylococcus aureus]NKP84527.1 hypothetical protein [Staphylococcus aureus]